MTTLATRTPTPEADGVPVDRLFRLSPEQFDRAREAGALPGDVDLIDGLLRRGGPSGPLHRLTLDQFHLADHASDLEHVELLGGWLVARAPIKPPHRFTTYQTREELARIVPAGYYVDQEMPSSLPRTDTEPLPDVQVIRGTSRMFAARHPGPEDIALLVEVSDSTVSFDRNFKKRLYAHEGVPIYWIVNLVARQVEVYTEPSGPSDAPGYRQRADFGADREVPVVLDGVEVGRIAVKDLLP